MIASVIRQSRRDVDPARLRQRMRGIGVRREEIAQAQRRVNRDTGTVLHDARGVIGVAESARLLGIARSYAYTVLRERGEGDDRPASGGCP